LGLTERIFEYGTMYCGTELGVTTGLETCEGLVRTHSESAHAGECMHVLAQLLRLSFDMTASGSKNDINRAVELARKAVAELDRLPAGHARGTSRQANLAFILTRRSKRLRRTEDIRDAHKIAIEVLPNSSNTDDSRVAMINILTELAGKEYDLTGAVSGMDLLLKFAEDSLSAASPENWDYFSQVNNLAHLLAIWGRVSKNIKGH
jgi:hypothetical protein